MPFKITPVYYSIWAGMKQRCTNPNNVAYKDYGARGISVCKRWVASYKTFEADMGERPPGHELDRIDNDGPYSHENCHWVTHKENMRNRRNTIYVVIQGATYLLSELVERYGIKPDTITDRVRKNMSFADVVTKEKHHNLSGLALGGKASGAKKRELTHCKHGHEFTPGNTKVTKQGWRRCKTCKNIRQLEYIARNK